MEVQTYSFGRSETQAPVMLSGLDRLGEKLGRRLRAVLEPMLGAKPGVAIQPVQMVEFGSWRANAPAFASFGIYRVAPLKGAVILRMDAGMVSALVDRFYGGSGSRPGPARREFTPTEERLVARLSASFMDGMKEAWADTLALDPVLAGRETSAAYIVAAQASDQLAVQRFDVVLGETSWPVELLIPIAALRAVEHLLGATAHDENQLRDPVWRARLSRRMGQVRLPARTVLARPELTLTDLMQLSPGDVIPISIGRSLPLIVGNRVIAHGNIGERNGRAAFMIENLVQGTDQ